MSTHNFEKCLTSLNYKVEPIWALVDETGFFSKHFVLRLKQKYLHNKPTAENFSVYDAKDLEMDSFLEGIQNLSLFASKKLIVVKGAQHFLKEKVQKLLSVLKSNPTGYCFVFIFSKKARHGLYTFFQKQKKILEFKKPYDSHISGWIQWMVRQKKKNIEPAACRLLFEKVGSELNLLENEIEKLILFIGPDETTIRAEDVEVMLYVSRTKSIFELTDALGYQNKAKALFTLENILQSGEPPLFVFTMLMRHLRNLWKATHWLGQKSDVETQRALGIHPYFWNQFSSQRDRWRKVKFEKIWKEATHIDQSLKHTSSDHNSILTAFVARLQCF